MARRHSFLEDNLTMIAMAALAVGFVLYTRRDKSSATINGLVGASQPPPRPRDRERDAVILEWLRSKQNPKPR